MVHKDEMCAIFKTLRSVDRIEILCGMFQLCVPQELRFIGSCLEDLIQKNYKLFYDAECIANDSKQLKDIARPLNKIDKEFCASLNTYLSLLHSDNTSCALSMFSILNDLKSYFEAQIFQSNNLLNDNLVQNNEFMEDIILIFTMASYHPAFTITQRLRMYEVCKSLKDILKNDGCKDNKEFEMSFIENDVARRDHQNIPVTINIKMLPGDHLEKKENFELEAIWTNGMHTSCLKSLCQIQHFQSQLFHAFPNIPELQSLNSFMHHGTPDPSLRLLNLEKYFKNLVTLPKFVLKCQVATDFLLCHSAERSSRSTPPADLAISLNTASNCSSKFFSNSDDAEFHCDGSVYAAKVLPFVTANSHEQEDPKLAVSSTNINSSNFRSQASVSQTTAFSCSNSDRLTNSGKGHSNKKWSHSDMKTKSAGSLTTDRLMTQHGHRHRHHHQERSQQQLSDTKETVISNVCHKSLEAMRECEEISSHLLMAKALPSPSETGSQDDQDCFPSCRGIHGGGDHISKHNACCPKYRFSEISPKNKQNKNTQESLNSFHPPLLDFPPSAPGDNNLLTVCIGSAAISASKGRPILGAASNQNCKMAVDDIRILGIESKPSSSVGVSLPRASSCGVILQQDHDPSALVSAEENQTQPTLSNLHLPGSTFPLDAYYSNVDSRINFLHLSPYSPFNQPGDCSHSQALPIPNIPPAALPPPPPLLNPSLVPPFSNNLSLNPPCTFCSSASIAPFSNYPAIWPHHIFFRSNGMLGPRFPNSGMRQCPGGMYLQAHFDYFPYNSPGMMVTSPSSVASVPSTITPLPPVPLPSPPKTCCHNCGSSNHTVDLCDEPFMLSVGQSAQFKLKTFPKNESSNC